ncbi:hypothetical protein CAPTEDRAFT_104360, partial [Capitella teleta]
SSSSGYDGLKSEIIKTGTRELCILLMHVINICLTSGIVPFEFKLAIITPVYKRDASIPSSYRPITLTSCLCKTLEWMVNGRLVFYLERDDLLAPSQSGTQS